MTGRMRRKLVEVRLPGDKTARLRKMYTPTTSPKKETRNTHSFPRKTLDPAAHSSHSTFKASNERGPTSIVVKARPTHLQSFSVNQQVSSRRKRNSIGGKTDEKRPFFALDYSISSPIIFQQLNSAQPNTPSYPISHYL
jgi:hypothetical protein